jgi:hypothetical protein
MGSRLVAIASSALSIFANLAYSVTITRKIPYAGLGLLAILNASIGFSTIPLVVLDFVYPRIAVRDSGLNVKNALLVNAMFFAVTAAMTAGYLASLWGNMGSYALPVLVIALLTEFSIYLPPIADAILMVRGAKKFLAFSFLQPAVKLAIIPFIMLAKWSIDAVLIATFVVVAAPPIATFLAASGRSIAGRSTREYLHDVLNASWVPAMGYGINTFRNLDTMVIGAFAYDQLGAWYIIRKIGTPFRITSNLPYVTYIELMNNAKKAVYYDLLIILALDSYIALTMAFFYPVMLNLFRPGFVVGLPMVLAMVAAASISDVNKFLDKVIHGVDKSDISVPRIRAKGYLRSLILKSHLAELAGTAAYLGSIVPLMMAFRGMEYYAVMGALAASVLSLSIATALKVKALGPRRALFNAGALARDIMAPLAISAIALYFVRGLIAFPLTHSFWLSLIQAVEAALLTAAIFGVSTLIISYNIRYIATSALRRAFSPLLSSFCSYCL